MRRPLRVGLVGGGRIAEAAQLPALVSDGDVELAGIVTATSQSAERLMRRWPFEATYPNVESMIEGARLDALFVLTPRLEHVRFVELGLSSGLEVFCEKPLAPTSAEAHRLADLAETTGRRLMVGFNRRYAEVYRHGRAQFEPGQAQFCVAQKHRQGSEYRATFENAIHMVDLLRWFCGGEATSVSAHAIARDPYQEDGIAALVRFSTGSIGSLIAARTAGLWDERLDAYGDSRSVRIVAPDSVTVDHDGQSIVREMRPRAFGWAATTTTVGFKPAVEHFLECVRDDREPLTNGREAALTQDLLDTILTAAGLPTSEAEGATWRSYATG